MGLLEKMVVGGLALLIGSGIRTSYRESQETKRRKNSPPQFDSRLTTVDFVSIAKRIASNTPRVVSVLITGMSVALEVQSNSGLTTWKAEIDFNDYGRLTGNYWVTSENSQSAIPDFFARAVQAEIRKRVP